MPESSSSRPKPLRLTQVCDADTTQDHKIRTNPVHERSSMSLNCSKDGDKVFLSLSTRSITIIALEDGEVQIRVDILRVFTDNSKATTKDIKDDPVMNDAIDMGTTCVIQEIHAEFGELRQHSILGQWKAEEDFKDIDMSIAAKELSEHVPLFMSLMAL